MDISRFPMSELADFAANLVELLTGSELASIDPAVRAELVAAFGTLPEQLATKTAAAAALDNEKQSMFSSRDQTALEIVILGRRTRDYLKAGDAPRSEFELTGFNFPSGRVAEYVAGTPSDLAVVGFSNGVNTGRFKGNNRGGAVSYEIWRREGFDSVWLSHILTTKQSFKDVGVTPGQYYEYRVRARAPQNDSDYSNTAVVYGVL